MNGLLTWHGLSATDNGHGSLITNQSVVCASIFSQGRSLPSPTQRRGARRLKPPTFRTRAQPDRRPQQARLQRARPHSARATLIGGTGGDGGQPIRSGIHVPALGGKGKLAGARHQCRRSSRGVCGKSPGVRAPAHRPLASPSYPPPRTRPGLCTSARAPGLHRGWTPTGGALLLLVLAALLGWSWLSRLPEGIPGARALARGGQRLRAAAFSPEGRAGRIAGRETEIDAWSQGVQLLLSDLGRVGYGEHL